MALICSFFFCIILTITITKNTLASVHAQCLEDQKTLLLELKSELIISYLDYSQKLARWNQTHDCCQWDGVECNGVGRVISLQLDGEFSTGGLNESSSLFRLRYLKKLSLADSYFYGSQKIPRAIHHLTDLTHLNLSHSGFVGQVPIELSLLRRLVVLDISTWFDQTLEIPNLKMLIRNLTSLREVYLDGVDISGAGSEWCQTISSSLPHLSVLSLRNCKLSGPFCPSRSQLHSLSVVRLDFNNLSTTIPESLANFSSLTTFSCSDCSLIGSIILKTILQVPTLQEIHLSNNKLLGGTIPQFRPRSALRSIYMSNCRFVGLIPSTLANLTELVDLDLSRNLLYGLIPTFYMSKKLTYINLSMNSLMGSLSHRHFEGLSNLAQLHLSQNSFSESIPASTIFALPSLELLDLSHNQFSGQINEFSSIVNFSNAFFSIDLSHNKLGGSIPHSFFALSSLRALQLSNNHFSWQVNESPLVNNIVFLDLSSNRLEGPIPDSFFQLQSLEFLYLSYNLFNGSFHLENINRFPNLTDLDLSYNNLSVDSPSIDSSLHGFPKLQTLRLASCNLSYFPDFLKQSHMSDLDLSNNRIAGDIPSWIWETVNNTFSQLNLSFNLLVNLQKPYHIPSSFLTLDLHSNQLQGELPALRQHSRYVDFSNNYFHGSIPSNIIKNNITNFWIGFLSLANNSLSGEIPASLCNFSRLEVLDLSFNNFTGIIPPCVVSTEKLQVLNLRGNNFNGVIPDQFFINCSLRTLDLSHNNLDGKIPKSLENCQGLEVVNVGYNNLDDNFPCMLSPSLHVLVLRSNKFHGEWRCDDKSWPYLQIVDISSNHFNGSLHQLKFSNWSGMVLQSDAHLMPNRSSSIFLGEWYTDYQYEVTLTVKGVEVNLVKIWPDFTSIDLSCNNFHGEIPDEVGNLTSLYLLNLSHNALTASIPKSLGALMELGSLDLSVNQLRGRIPEELAGLTFLSILNLSYNELVGMIPKGPQFNTFSSNSFEGNTELCGFPLNTSCSSTDGNGSTAPTKEKDVDEEEIEWEYVCAAAGYVVGLGSIAWSLLFYRRFRERYFDKIEEVAENILDRRERRRRHGRTSVVRRNGVRRH